ncbi:MAG TPA: hypothetical protein PLD82_09600 [Spirochaetota bacterium]|nr:hypothetical protein [Spirochaetota bacterium]HPH02284.1 hypothetical protein [Spirochaetota bacterium]
MRERCFRFFLTGLYALAVLLPSRLFSAVEDGLSPAVFFVAWDPWRQTGCRAVGEQKEERGFRVQYDPWFRVARATRIEDGSPKDVWSYSWNEHGILQRAWRRSGQILLESAEYDQDGRFVRLHRHNGMNDPQSSEEYVYGRDGRLMVIKTHKGKDLEMVTEVRYHPSGAVFMHVMTNGGNAVIGRVLFDTDSEGRVLVERHFLWGWLVKTVRRAWCPHGVLLSVEEQVPGWAERVRDPFFVEHKPSTP